MSKEMIFSVLLASGVVVFGVSLMNSSLLPLTQKEAQIEQKQTTVGNQSSQISEHEQTQEAPAKIGNTETIAKCTIDGKVIYSDRPCPKNATLSQVEIHETSGIVTPSRDVVDRTMRRIEEERRRENQSTRSSLSVIEKPNKQLCNAYRADIDKYDSMARQPQSGSAQDWIREEIVRIRKLQAQANC